MMPYVVQTIFHIDWTLSLMDKSKQILLNYFKTESPKPMVSTHQMMYSIDKETINKVVDAYVEFMMIMSQSGSQA